MHSQTVEVAAFAHNVAAESLAMLLWGIKLAAANANVVAEGNRQGVHHVALSGIVVLENFGQHTSKSIRQRQGSMACSRRLKRLLEIAFLMKGYSSKNERRAATLT